MDRLITLVISAVGVDWINAATDDVPKSIPLPFPKEYLAHLFATAGDSQIVEVLELGQYLDQLHAVPGIGVSASGAQGPDITKRYFN